MELCRTWWISGEKRFQNTKTSFKDRLFTRPMKAWGRESQRRLATYLDLAPLCDNQFLHPMFMLGHQPLTVCDRKVLDTIMKVLMIKVSLYCCENKINTITPQFYYEHFSPRHEILWPRPSLCLSPDNWWGIWAGPRVVTSPSSHCYSRLVTKHEENYARELIVCIECRAAHWSSTILYKHILLKWWMKIVA